MRQAFSRVEMPRLHSHHPDAPRFQPRFEWCVVRGRRNRSALGWRQNLRRSVGVQRWLLYVGVKTCSHDNALVLCSCWRGRQGLFRSCTFTFFRYCGAGRRRAWLLLCNLLSRGRRCCCRRCFYRSCRRFRTTHSRSCTFLQDHLGLFYWRIIWRFRCPTTFVHLVDLLFRGVLVVPDSRQT